MSLKFTSGVVGAEARDELIREGSYLFEQIWDEYFVLARDKSINHATGERAIPSPVGEAICIALALFVRQQVGV